MKDKTLLVTGGAGYIGSHLLLALKDSSYNIIVADNLSTGHRDNVVHGKLVVGDLRDKAFIEQLFSHYTFDAVLHFSASTSVPESILSPDVYFENNTVATFNLMQACIAHKVKHFIFSSTAAVYGTQKSGVVDEDTVPNPINPYGQSKWLAEQIILSCAQAHGLHTIILRYFNVAGVDESYLVGPRSHKAPHLFKALVDTALGRQPSLAIFGDHYATPDGTGIRDYIHVNDLISAHIHALDYLFEHKRSMVLNCGYGHGYSVKQVLEASQSVFGRQVPYHVAPPRAGDCAQMIAKPNRLKQNFNWQPRYNDLALILKSQYDWEMTLQQTSSEKTTEKEH